MADTPNELDVLIIMLIVLEELGSSEVPRVHLGCMSWHAGDTNGLGHRADGSNSQMDGLTVEMDGSRAQMDASNTSNNAEMADISCDEGAGAYLGAGGMKQLVDRTDGLGDQMDACQPSKRM